MGSTDSNCCGSHGLVTSDDPNSKTIGRIRIQQNTEPPLKTDQHSIQQQPSSHRQHTISKTSKISNHTFDITANIRINSSSNLQNYNSIPSITFNFDSLSNSHSHMIHAPNMNMNIKNNNNNQPQQPTIYKQYTNTKNNYNNNYNSPTIPIINPCPTINNNKNENISNYNIKNTTNWIENVYDNDSDDDDDDIDDDNDTKNTNTNNSNGQTTPISYLSDAQNTTNTNQSNGLNSYSENDNDENDNDDNDNNYNDNYNQYEAEENKYDLDNMPLLQLQDENSNEKYVRSVNYLRPEEIINNQNLLTPNAAKNWKKEDMDKLESEMRRELRRLSVSTVSVTSLNSL